jgi:DNA replication protein DnaC
MEHIFNQPMTPEERAKNEAESFNLSSGSLNLTDGYNCDKCRNRGLIMRAFENGGVWSTVCSECDCVKIRTTIKRMQRSGLKNIIKDYTFAKYQAVEDWQVKLKDAAVKYADNPSGWFFIGGQTGAGKTHLCTAICREFLLNGRAVKYMLWRDDVVRLKGAVNDTDTYASLMDAYKRTEVLYIDDLFKTGKGADGQKQQPTAADINIAFEILNYRYNNPALLTIISSECTVNDIIEIDEATGGRIFERAEAFSLKPDKRKNYRLKGVVEL